jgi:hypothetical protein
LEHKPKFCTPCDSNCPGVSENKACDASSGMNVPPANDRIRSAIAVAMACSKFSSEGNTNGDGFFHHIYGLKTVNNDLRVFRN